MLKFSLRNSNLEVSNLKRVISIVLLFLLFFSSLFSNSQNVNAAEDILGIKAEAAILIEASTGKILYQKNPDMTLPPASMTKMMTEYLVLEAIKENTISWDQELQITDYVLNISQNRNLSNVPLRQDTKYTVKELYEAMAIYSANGATIALAELVAGSETNFVKMMEEKAKELKLSDYDFVNSTGLNNSDLNGNHPEGTGPDDENYLSARSTAKLAFHLYNDFPEVLKTASIPVKWFREGTKDSIKMLNWNYMLPGMPGALAPYSYEGMDGLKTGSTDLAGFCFTGTAERNGMRLISVVMRTESKFARFEETKKLMDYGFNNFAKQELYPANYQIDGESILSVEKGKENNVEISTTKPLATIIKRNEEGLYKPKYVFDNSTFNENGALTAPVEKGKPVGYMTFDYTGEVNYGYIGENGPEIEKVPVATIGSVEKANWFVLTMRGIGSFFADIWTSVANTIKGLFS